MSWKSLIENINNSNKVINKIDPTQANGSLLAMYYPCFTKEETEVEVLWWLHYTAGGDWAGITSQDLLTEESAHRRRWTLGSTELDLNSGSAAHVTLGNLYIFYFTQCPGVHSGIKPTSKDWDKTNVKKHKWNTENNPWHVVGAQWMIAIK